MSTSLDMPQALYRFYDAHDRLLYIGVTGDIGSRWKAHNKLKPWWTEVARCTIEHHPDRPSVLAAETAAIKTEKPLHNITHNRTGPQGTGDSFATCTPAGVRDWTFTSRETRYTRTVPLWLYWEVDGDPVSDEYTPTEADAVELWNLWRRQYPTDPHSAFGPTAKRIWWYVEGPGTLESAPGQNSRVDGYSPHEHFLSCYTWPVNAHTGEPVQWPRLPTVDKLWRPGRADKGGFIQEATGWKPSPFQPYVDVEQLETLARL